MMLAACDVCRHYFHRVIEICVRGRCGELTRLLKSWLIHMKRMEKNCIKDGK